MCFSTMSNVRNRTTGCTARVDLVIGFPVEGAFGGACRDRTDDPLLAKQVLSQLS